MVEAMQLEKIPDEDKPDPGEDEATYVAQLRENLPPQFLNICMLSLWQESYSVLGDIQIASMACVKLTEKQEAKEGIGEEQSQFGRCGQQ